uniref:DUF4216 domain-containing protein n=1 Tax=Aciditerrimonas ferrireducens TaxID=667306 RepID=UPI00366D0406
MVEVQRKTQNSGVVVRANTGCFARSSDRNPVTEDITYYGVLTDVIRLNYGRFINNKTLFRCDWFDVHTQSGIKKDEFGFTCLNINKRSQQIDQEPFILAEQAEQAFYVSNPVDPGWVVAMTIRPRDFFDLLDEDSITEDSSDPTDPHREEKTYTIFSEVDVGGNEDLTWVRQDVEVETIDVIITNLRPVVQDDFMNDID